MKATELTNVIHQIEQKFIDFEHKKNFALKYGCCLDNPSFLFLNHIYVDIPENYFYRKHPKSVVSVRRTIPTH